MRVPNSEQQSVLDNSARVRVVRAAPGSGKTWLVAEVIRQELAKRIDEASGIAALSFTRVGGEEIRKAVGHELGHPHFVGTIDAFFFRYIVRPFLQKCFSSFATPRLIPAEWGPQFWNRYGRDQKTTVDNGINLFGCVFINEEKGKVVVAYKPHPAGQLVYLDELDLIELIKEGKKKIWKNSGYLTHSDAALLASKILEHSVHGAAIRTEIIRRFPLLIVDELQDTGYFLGKSVRLLLNEPGLRGLVVGDPDQAIYEFTGAYPALFSDFESIQGAVTLPLSNSQRCPLAITTVASPLKNTGGTIEPNPDKTGRAFLLSYDDMVVDIQRIAETVTSMQPDKSIKVIARHTTTVEIIIGRKIRRETLKLGCPPLNHIQRAVINFHQGRQVAALAAARAALELAVFQHEGIQDTDLEKQGIDPIRWKHLAVDCLLKVVAESMTDTLYDWQTRLGEILDQTIGGFGLDPSLQFSTGRLKPKKIKGWNTPCDYIVQSNISAESARVTAQTVHSVKGETHDVTIFVCPDTRRAADCPSVIWWSSDERSSEEKRIAYVAMTRSQGDLIVCVSKDSYKRLCSSQKSFVNNFEYKTVDEFVKTFDHSGVEDETARSSYIELENMHHISITQNDVVSYGEIG